MHESGVKIVGIATYQVQNILRVYNKQLRFEKIAPREKNEHMQVPSDEVSISDEAKKEQILRQARSQAIQQVMAKVSKPNEMEDILGIADEMADDNQIDRADIERKVGK
ncbi:MAG: DVU0524 family FlgM-associated protein [Thermodesulfobacteriota bacterium]|nr:DVU0524 family FlgM-associated protein [Thermodesulfobacteriota bacterium]